jgi:hypothetical protein
MEVKKNYGKVLNEILEENGLDHFYEAHGEYDMTLDAHRIVKVTREPKTFLGIDVPFTGTKDRVATVRSEARQAKSQHTYSRLQYNGLEIQVTNEKYADVMRNVCERLEQELEEPVKLVI